MKKYLALLLAVMMVFSVCACGNSAGDDAAKTEKLSFGTGGEAGTYYAFGGVISQYVTNNTNVEVKAITSGGSAANVGDIDAGDIELGFCQSDVMAYAYKGERTFDAAIDSFSVVAALYMEDVQIVTVDPSIKSVADLKGKSVSVGDQGSGVYFNAVDVLEAYGLTIDDIEPVYQGFGDSTESMKDGKIDAAFVVAGAPTTSIVDLATAKEVNLVSIDDEHIDILMKNCPYYSKHVIPADAYGLAEDTQTVAVAAVVLAGDDVSADAVYAFVSTIYDNIGELQHDKANELNLDFAASMTTVPYHPGAAQYFAEQGIDVAVK